MMGEWLVAGVVFCVLPSVVMRSWCWEEAHKKRSGARDDSMSGPGDMRDSLRGGGPVCLLLCAVTYRGSCRVIMNY